MIGHGKWMVPCLTYFPSLVKWKQRDLYQFVYADFFQHATGDLEAKVKLLMIWGGGWLINSNLSHGLILCSKLSLTVNILSSTLWWKNWGLQRWKILNLFSGIWKRFQKTLSSYQGIVRGASRVCKGLWSLLVLCLGVRLSFCRWICLLICVLGRLPRLLSGR